MSGSLTDGQTCGDAKHRRGGHAYARAVARAGMLDVASSHLTSRSAWVRGDACRHLADS